MDNWYGTGTTTTCIKYGILCVFLFYCNTANLKKTERKGRREERVVVKSEE